jgi:hypothetical protein
VSGLGFFILTNADLISRVAFQDSANANLISGAIFLNSTTVGLIPGAGVSSVGNQRVYIYTQNKNQKITNERLKNRPTLKKTLKPLTAQKVKIL